MKLYIVNDFGAVGDGAADDSASIQKAIDLCSENGGGTVVLLSGHTYFSSSIQLKKGVDLHIQKGAVLKATDKIENYIRPCETINDPKTALVGNPVTGKPFWEAMGFTSTGEICPDNGQEIYEKEL